jgi:hypothetical protein
VNTCTVEFARLSAGLGGLRCDGNPIVTFTNPLALQDWTSPCAAGLDARRTIVY